MHLNALAQAVRERMLRERPQAVFTHPYEGGHADHDACAFAVHAAVRQMHETGEAVPLIVESPFYFRREGGELQTGEFLSVTGGPERVYPLHAWEQQRKQAVFAAFPTQDSILRVFRTDCERYRIAPKYDFTRPPHAGTAHYESFMDGMTAARFSSLAAQALLAMAGEVRA